MIICVCVDVSNAENEGLKNDDFLTNVTRTNRYKVLKFGQGSVGHGRDSRYWDRDDRRRDEDYNEDVLEHSSEAATNDASDKGDVLVQMKNGNKKSSLDDSTNGSDRRGVGLYNEAGRSELKVYEAQYKASLEDVGQTSSENGNSNQLFDAEDLKKQTEVVDTDDEYDDGFGFHDGKNEDYDDNGHGKGDHFDESDLHNEDVGGSRESSDLLNAGDENQNVAEVEEKSTNSHETRNYDSVKTKSRRGRANGRQSTRTRSDSKRKAKRRKYFGNSFVFLCKWSGSMSLFSELAPLYSGFIPTNV